MYQNDVQFGKFDGTSLFVKLTTRFGAATISLVLAQAIFYPFDTVKRCLQLNGSRAHKNPYQGGIVDCMRTIYQEQGLRRGLYSGFSLNLARLLPMHILNFLVFKFIRGAY